MVRKYLWWGNIYVPRINKPDGIKTADYLFQGEKWDLKTVQGCKAQTLYHAIYKNGNQSHNFIFEILNPSLSLFNSSKQVDKIYQRTDIPFFDKCIIKKGENFVIFKRIKKEYDRTVRSARPHSLQNNIHCFNEYVNIKSKNSFFLFF